MVPEEEAGRLEEFHEPPILEDERIPRLREAGHMRPDTSLCYHDTGTYRGQYAGC